jgi:hypothetical protein
MKREEGTWYLFRVDVNPPRVMAIGRTPWRTDVVLAAGSYAACEAAFRLLSGRADRGKA